MTLNTPFMLQAVAGDTAIEYTAQEVRAWLDAVAPNEGVCGVGHLAVTPRAAGANWSVDIAPGLCIILGDSIANQGKYVMRSTAIENRVIPTAPASGQRVHRVIAHLYDKQADSGTAYKWDIEVQEDTGTGTPALPPSAIELALVTVKAGDGAVNAASVGTPRPPRATGLPARAPKWEFVDGFTNLPTRQTTLYTPAECTVSRDVTVPSPTQARVIIKVPGTYNVDGGARIAGSGPGTNASREVVFHHLNSAGVLKRKATYAGGQGVNTSSVAGAASFDCVAGDEVRMSIYNSTANTHTVPDTHENWFRGVLTSLES